MHDDLQPSSQHRSLRRPAVAVGPLAAVALVILASVLAGDGKDADRATAVSSGAAVVAPGGVPVTIGSIGVDAAVVPAAAPVPAGQPPVPPPPSTGSVTPATTAPPDAPLPAEPCRNSSDPGCGPFSWHPAPGADQPLTISFEVVPAAPRAGDLVTVHVVAADPDAEVSTNGGTWHFADPHSTEVQIGFPLTITRGVERYGAWTPPEPRPGRLELSFTHTFSLPGTYSFTFGAVSGDDAEPGNAGRNPYASRASVTVPITVGPS